MARKLIPILRQAGQEVDRELEDMASRGGGGGGGRYSSSGHDPLEEDEADDHSDAVELLELLLLLLLRLSLSKDAPTRDCNDGPDRCWAEPEDTDSGRGSPIGGTGPRGAAASASATSTAVPPSACVVAEYGAAGGQPPSLASE